MQFKVERVHLQRKMAVTDEIAERRYHARYNSMTLRSHLFVCRVEEKLYNLKLHMSSVSVLPSSGTGRAESTQIALRFRNLYSSIKDLLCLPRSSQESCSQPQQKKWAEELDVSLRLMDPCNAVKDITCCSQRACSRSSVHLPEESKHDF